MALDVVVLELLLCREGDKAVGAVGLLARVVLTLHVGAQLPGILQQGGREGCEVTGGWGRPCDRGACDRGACDREACDPIWSTAQKWSVV